MLNFIKEQFKFLVKVHLIFPDHSCTQIREAYEIRVSLNVYLSEG